MGRVRCAGAVVGVALGAVGPVRADLHTEGFDGGVFTSPVFVHDFEFVCCWMIVDRAAGEGDYWLHLSPNTDAVSFSLPTGADVRAVSVRIEDTEGGFSGLPTSVVVVRGETGDFVVLRASQLDTPEVVSADALSPGQLTGMPIGLITGLELQASNENNGAFFDDLTVDIVGGEPPCVADFDMNGRVDSDDYFAFLTAFFEGSETADVNGDGVTNSDDYFGFLGAFFEGC